MINKATISIATLMFSFFSCQTATQGKKLLDFGLFTFEAPTTWTAVPHQGLETFYGEIAIAGSDTLIFDVGWSSYYPPELPRYKVRNSKVYALNDSTLTSTSASYEYVGEVGSVDTTKFILEITSYTVVDNRNAKLVVPKKSGYGKTGVYIDSLWQAGSVWHKFEMSGRNLKPENERNFVQAVKTLKFKK
jgi:hypothetical protein